MFSRPIWGFRPPLLMKGAPRPRLKVRLTQLHLGSSPGVPEDPTSRASSPRAAPSPLLDALFERPPPHRRSGRPPDSGTLSFSPPLKKKKMRRRRSPGESAAARTPWEMNDLCDTAGPRYSALHLFATWADRHFYSPRNALSGRTIHLPVGHIWPPW